MDHSNTTLPSTAPAPRRNPFAILLRKDISTLLHSREGVVSLITLVLMNAIVLAVGTSSALLPPALIIRIVPTLIWASFVFSVMTFVEQGCALDYRERAIDAILVAGVSPVQIFLSKVLAISLFSGIGCVIATTVIAILLNVSLWSFWASLFVCIVLVSIGFSSLLVLLSTLTIHARLQGILLPLIAIPLSFPLLLGGIELSLDVILGGGLGDSSWLPLLLIADVIYFVGGINLYEFAVKA